MVILLLYSISKSLQTMTSKPNKNLQISLWSAFQTKNDVASCILCEAHSILNPQLFTNISPKNHNSIKKKLDGLYHKTKLPLHDKLCRYYKFTGLSSGFGSIPFFYYKIWKSSLRPLFKTQLDLVTDKRFLLIPKLKLVY